MEPRLATKVEILPSTSDKPESVNSLRDRSNNPSSTDEDLAEIERLSNEALGDLGGADSYSNDLADLSSLGLDSIGEEISGALNMAEQLYSATLPSEADQAKSMNTDAASSLLMDQSEVVEDAIDERKDAAQSPSELIGDATLQADSEPTTPEELPQIDALSELKQSPSEVETPNVAVVGEADSDSEQNVAPENISELTSSSVADSGMATEPVGAELAPEQDIGSDLSNPRTQKVSLDPDSSVAPTPENPELPDAELMESDVARSEALELSAAETSEGTAQIETDALSQSKQPELSDKQSVSEEKVSGEFQVESSEPSEPVQVNPSDKELDSSLEVDQELEAAQKNDARGVPDGDAVGADSLTVPGVEEPSTAVEDSPESSDEVAVQQVPEDWVIGEETTAPEDTSGVRTADKKDLAAALLEDDEAMRIPRRDMPKPEKPSGSDSESNREAEPKSRPETQEQVPAGCESTGGDKENHQHSLLKKLKRLPIQAINLKRSLPTLAVSLVSVLFGVGISWLAAPTAPATIELERPHPVLTADIEHRIEPIAPIVPFERLDPDVVALGKQLFHDPALSGSGRTSCASCHRVDQGGIDGKQHFLGSSAGTPAGARIIRDTPTVLNAGLHFAKGWDGQYATLEQHLDHHLESEAIMESSWTRVVDYLQSDRAYNLTFQLYLGGEPTRAKIREALATYERSLTTPFSAFDDWLRGNPQALSVDAMSGYLLFKKFNCISCHQGAGVGGTMFQPLGGMAEYFASKGSSDSGRFQVTQVERDRNVFRVPSLRNVERTSPYFHDGSAEKLEDAVHAMIKYQVGVEPISVDVQRLTAFLRALTGEATAPKGSFDHQESDAKE